MRRPNDFDIDDIKDELALIPRAQDIVQEQRNLAIGTAIKEDVVLITPNDLATILGVSKRSVWRYRAAGKLPKPFSICNTIRWRLSDIKEFIEKKTERGGTYEGIA